TVAALPPANFSLTNTVGAAATVTVGWGTSQRAGSETGRGAAQVALVKDAGNNPLPGVTVNFAVTPAGGASATLSGATAVTNAVGLASVTATANATVGGPYTVAATVAALPPANFSLQNTVGAAATLTVASGSGQ